MSGGHKRPASEEGDAKQSDPTELFSMLNHELRTPLSALLGFADLLRPDMSAAELVELVHRIKSCAKALSEVVETLQDLPKLERGELQLEEAAFDIVELTHELLESLGEQAQRKGLALRVELDSRVPKVVRGACGSLRQVLTNLLCNAIKFTDTGEVCLRVELLDGSADEIRLRYAVVDTGRGIAADMQQRVFERFVRVEEDLHARTPGSGLGLSICRLLLQAMGSRMELQSQIGEGSCFSFEMTHALRCDEALPSTTEWAPEHSSRGAEAIRVLVVDDDTDNRELLGRWVRGAGYAADLACNAREALSMVDYAEYALLLTDLHMPGVDGFELARLLRERETQTMKPRTPLVAVTADSLLQGESSRALEQSFDSVLIKPVQPRLLRRLLARCLPESGAASACAAASRRTLVDASLIDLVPDYLARRREDLLVLRAFLSGHAPVERVMTIAHRMRGTGLSYGFPRIGKLGAFLEEAARAQGMDRMADIVEELERFVEQAERRVSTAPEMKRTASHGL